MRAQLQSEPPGRDTQGRSTAMTGLYYELSGRKDGPVLLLVHGFMSSRAQWMPNLAALGEIAQLAVVELLGHGRSPAPAEAEPPKGPPATEVWA